MHFARMQALQTLLTCTSEDMFAWHTALDSPSHQSAEQRVLWQQMFDLSKTQLVPQLVQLWDEPFPGAAAQSLQLFAFFVSWLRQNFCQSKKLRLSQEILDKLQVSADASQTAASIAPVTDSYTTTASAALPANMVQALPFAAPRNIMLMQLCV